MTKPTESWMGKNLLTTVAKVRLQPVKSMIEKKGGNEKVGTQRRVKQSQGWRAKIGLKRVIKWLKQRKSK